MSQKLEHNALPQAVLWDMDGTLIDSESYWVAAEIALVERFGGRWTHEDGLTLVGMGLPESATVLQNAGVDLELHDIIQRLTDDVMSMLTSAVPWRPGAVSFMNAFADAGIPQAIVTMSLNRMASLVASAIPGSPISAVVSGDRVKHSKPHPEPYWQGAELLNVDINHCLAFEDSVAGLQSAFSSGAVTIGLPNIVDISNAPAHDKWLSLPEQSVQDAIRLYRSVRIA